MKRMDTSPNIRIKLEDDEFTLDHGSIVIAAITSCTNTSNPYVMIAAGLLAKKAVERGLQTKPWVKTSLAPGSKVVSAYFDAAGLTPYLEKLRFNTVGYGCTTCIGNSGPLPEAISKAVDARQSRRRVGAVGQPQLRGAHQWGCQSQLFDVAAAGHRLCARWDVWTVDIMVDPLGKIARASQSICEISGPRRRRSRRPGPAQSSRKCSTRITTDVFKGDERWNSLHVEATRRYRWDEEFDLCAPSTVFRWHDPNTPTERSADQERASTRDAGRQRDHRSHFSGW